MSVALEHNHATIRHLTKNFLGREFSWNTLKKKINKEAIIYNTKKKDPTGKNLLFSPGNS